MTNERFFAVICTADLATASAWYAKLFGRDPDRRPMPSLAEWQGEGGLQLLERADAAGKGFLTLMVDDIEEARADIQRRGLEVGAKQEGDVAGIAQLRDPDGNTVTLAAPAI